ncbi:unnamed protein product [Mytilus coruscus]|uniref:Uncharacterized protein n=1 Tax=Mytilus coruscus TaxID=42192 RepID=A0A6J8DC84_MYTCO|nr:unnamed protein product [Mytilus coruscus]
MSWFYLQLHSISSKSNLCDQSHNNINNTYSTQTILTHNISEDNVYYESNYTEELVENTSFIQEATLASATLEEGFPQDRLTQTINSGNYRPNKGVQVNRFPMPLQFRQHNIYTGDVCRNDENRNNKCVQTVITYIYIFPETMSCVITIKDIIEHVKTEGKSSCVQWLSSISDKNEEKQCAVNVVLDLGQYINDSLEKGEKLEIENNVLNLTLKKRCTAKYKLKLKRTELCSLKKTVCNLNNRIKSQRTVLKRIRSQNVYLQKVNDKSITKLDDLKIQNNELIAHMASLQNELSSLREKFKDEREENEYLRLLISDDIGKPIKLYDEQSRKYTKEAQD